MSDSVISRRVEDIDGLFDCLLEQHPEPVCELNFKSPFELLVAVILSAQCTDKRVNEVTSHIFDKYNTPKQFADMRQEDLERMIFSCGFYRNKAANIIAASKDIVDKFGGEVPSDFDSLLSLAGVGRKTANVVSAVAFGEQTMPRWRGRSCLSSRTTDLRRRIICSYITAGIYAPRALRTATSAQLPITADFSKKVGYE